MQPLTQLFIFPHAGGSEVSYFQLKKKLSPYFRVSVLTYPGRGKRIMEPAASDVPSLVKDICNLILPELDGGDFFFWGHSFGALVAFECIRDFNRKNIPVPAAAVFSGRRAPSYAVSNEKKHLLSDQLLVEYLDNMGGIPKELIGNEDFLSFYLPIIRNDLKLNETYIYKEDNKLGVKLLLLNGSHDLEVTEEAINAWECETYEKIDKEKMEGDHFFIFNNENVTYRLISYLRFKPD